MMDDMYSLLEWAREEELKVHNSKANTHSELKGQLEREKAFREMIDKIEKSPTLLHRTLTFNPNIKVMGDAEP